MNRQEMSGAWSIVKGMAKARWGELTSNDLMIIAGNIERLVSILQTVYGFSKERAEEEYRNFKEAVAMVEFETKRSTLFKALVYLSVGSLAYVSYLATTSFLKYKYSAIT